MPHRRFAAHARLPTAGDIIAARRARRRAGVSLLECRFRHYRLARELTYSRARLFPHDFPNSGQLISATIGGAGREREALSLPEDACWAQVRK